MKKRYLSMLAIILSLSIAFVFCAPSNIYAYDDDEYTCKYVNSKYHYAGYCGYSEHEWEESYVAKKATYYQDGKVKYYCWECEGTKTVPYTWKLARPDSEYHKSYNVIGHTIVYPKSKSITVWLDNILIGSVVKVRIGKKTYTKKVGTSKKIKINITPAKKYGYRVYINVYLNGVCVGSSYSYSHYYDDEYDETVYYCYLNQGDWVYSAKDKH